jgi:hypothetical protein
MDLRVFYQKLRQIESQIVDAHPVLVSHETPDGGKAGVRTEVSRPVAARMVAEGKARLGTEAEAAEFRDAIVQARKAAEQALMAGRVALSVVPEAELQMLRGVLNLAKSNLQEKEKQ